MCRKKRRRKKERKKKKRAWTIYTLSGVNHSKLPFLFFFFLLHSSLPLTVILSLSSLSLGSPSHPPSHPLFLSVLLSFFATTVCFLSLLHNCSSLSLLCPHRRAPFFLQEALHHMPPLHGQGGCFAFPKLSP